MKGKCVICGKIIDETEFAQYGKCVDCQKRGDDCFTCPEYGKCFDCAKKGKKNHQT